MGKTADSVKDDATVETSGHATGKVIKTVYSSRVEKRTSQASVAEKSSVSRDVRSVGLTDFEDSSHLSALEEGTGDSVYNVQKFERRTTTTDDGAQAVTVSKNAVEHIFKSENDKQPRKHASETVTIHRAKSALSTDSDGIPSSSQFTDTPASPTHVQAGFGSTLESSNEGGFKRINPQSSTTAITSVHDSEVTHRVTRSRRRSSDQEDVQTPGNDTDKGEFTVLSKPKVPWILSSQELRRDIKKKRRPLSCDADFFSGNFETGDPNSSAGIPESQSARSSSEDARKVTGKDLLALKVKTEDVPQLRSSLEGGKLIRIRSLNDLDQTESESTTITRTTTRVRQKKRTTEESVREKLAELKRESEAKKLGKNPPAHATPVALSSALTWEESIQHHSSVVDSVSTENSVIKINTDRKNRDDGEKAATEDKGKVVKRTSFNVGVLKRSRSEEQAEEGIDPSDVLFGHVRELRKSCENLLLEEVDVKKNSNVKKELSNFRFILNSQAQKKPSDERFANSEIENRSNTSRSLTSLTIELKNQDRNRFASSKSLDSEITRNNVQEDFASALTEQLVHAEVDSSSSSEKSSSEYCTEGVAEVAWSQQTRKETDGKYDYFVEKQRTRVNLARPLNQTWDDDVDEGIYILKDFVEQLICEDRSRNISGIRNLSDDSEAGYFTDDDMIRKGPRPPGLGSRTASLPEMTRTEFLEKHQEDAAAKKRRNTVGGSNPDLTKRVIKVKVPSRLLQSTAASKGKQKKKMDYVPLDRKPDLVFEDRPIRLPESGWVKQEFVKYPEPKTPRVQRKPKDQVIEDVEETVEWSNPRRKQSALNGSRKTSWVSNASDRQTGSSTDLSQPEMQFPTRKTVELNSQLQPNPTDGVVTSGRNSGNLSRQAATPEKNAQKPQDRLLPKRKVWGVDVSTDEEDKEEEKTDDFATKKHAFLSSTLNSDFAYNPYSIFSTPSTIFTPLSAGTHESNTFKYIYTIDAEISYREYNKLMSIINMLQEQKRRWEDEVADAKEKFDKSGKEKMQLAHNNHILRQSLEAANKAIKEINGKVQELKQTLIPLREDNATLRGENTELKQKLELTRKEKEIFIAEVQSLKMSKSSTEELVEFKETEMEEYKILMHEKFRKLEESYRVYRDDMERKHQTMHGESNDIRHQNETQRREIDALRKDCIALMNEINELKQSNDNLKAELARKPTTDKVTASEEFRQMTEKRNKIEENLNMELDKYREETRNLETENDQLKTDLDNMECRMKELEAVNEISKQERMIEAQQNEVFRNHINELKKQHGDYEELKQKKLHLTEERDRYRKQVEHFQQQVEEIEYLKHERSFFETDIKRQHEEIENLKTQLLDVEELKSERLAFVAENERLKQELDFLRNQLRILETKQIAMGSPYNDELKSELESLRNQMRDLASINQQKVTDIQNEQLKGEIQSLRNQIQDLDAFNRAQMAKYDTRTQLHQQTSEIKVSEKEKNLEKHFYIRDSDGNLREVKTTKDGLVAELPQNFSEESNRLVSTSTAPETFIIPEEALPKSPGNDDSFGTAMSSFRATNVSMTTEQPRNQISEEEILMQARVEDLAMPTEQTRRQESPLSEPELGYDTIPTKQDRIDDITKRYEEKGSLGGESPQRRLRRNSTGEVDLDATERSRDRSRKEKRIERSKTTEIHLTTENTRDHTIEHHHHHHYYGDKKEDKKDESVGPDSFLTEEERAKVIEERIRWKQQHDTMWSLRTPDINKLQRRSVEADMDKVARFDEAMLPIRTSSLDRKELRNFSEQRKNQEVAEVTKLAVKIDEDTSSSPNTTKEDLRHKVVKNRTAVHSDSRHHENVVKHVIVEPREPVKSSAFLTSREQEIAQLKLRKADVSKMGAQMKIGEAVKVKHQEMGNAEGGHAEAGVDAHRKKKRNKADEMKAREERRLKDRDIDDSSTTEEERDLKDRVGRAKLKKKDGLISRSESRDTPINRSEPREPSLEVPRDEKMRSQTSTKHKHFAHAQESQVLQVSAATWPDEADNGILRTSSDSRSMRPKERTDTGILRTSSDSHPTRPKGRTAGPRVVGLQTTETLVRVENRHDLHAAESYQENINNGKGISIATGTLPGKRTADPTSHRNNLDHVELTNSSTSLDSQRQDQKMSHEIRSVSKASENSEVRSSSVSRSQNKSNQIYQETVVPKQESSLQSSVATKAGNGGRSTNGKVEMLSQAKSSESSERRANAESRTQNKSNQLHQEKVVTEHETALKSSMANTGRHEERSRVMTEILETLSQDKASESSGSRASSVSRSDSKSSKLYQERTLSKQEVNVYSSSYISGGEHNKTTNGAATLQGSEKNWIAAGESKGQYNSNYRGSDELKGDHHGYDHSSLSSSSSFRSSRRESHDQRMTHFEQYTGGHSRSNDGLQKELRQSEIDAMERARLRMLEKVNSGKVHSTISEEKKFEENILQGHITVDGELVQRRNTGDATRTEDHHKRKEVRLSDSSDASREHVRDKIPAKINEHDFQATEARQGQVRRSSSQSVKSVSQSDYDLQVAGHQKGGRQTASLERIAYQSSSLEQGTTSRLAKPPRPPKTYTRYAPQYHSVEVLPRVHDPHGIKTVNRRDQKSVTSAARDDRKRFSAMSNDSLGGFSQITYTTVSEASFGPRHIDDYATQVEGLEDLRSEVDSLTRHESMNLLAKPAKENQVTREYQSTREVSQGHQISQGRK